jgi:HAD superfamily hydrolase (TIGR01509 family)
MNQIRGVLLDIDGTLVQSNDEHARAWVEALNEGGRSVSYEAVRPLIGMGGDKLLPKVAGISADSPEGRRLSDRRGEIFAEVFLPHLKPSRGARGLLELLKSRGFKMAVVSSAKKDELEPLLKVCGADQVIEARTSSDDVDRSKPDPDAVLAALGEIGLPASDVVMLGDTPYDIESAKKAGVQVIALRCGGWEDAGLAGASAIYDDPEELARRIDTSPLAT